MRSGRSHVGYINIAWTLRDVRPEQGGFCAIAGSHKARLPLPGVERWADTQGYGLSADPTPLEASGHLRHIPLTRGSVVIFMGAAQTHGAYTWRGEEERRVVLYGAYSRPMKGSFTGGGGGGGRAAAAL
jgi:ectoine hydroxylase-related dioxygenase (phytanoyl-CoA dioxygenase family)